MVMYIKDFCTLYTQDQYEKLSKDYEAVSVDRGFMTESMTALKKREGELVSELQQCKVCINIPADLCSYTLCWSSPHECCCVNRAVNLIDNNQL